MGITQVIKVFWDDVWVRFKTHTEDASAHHEKYTDAEAQTLIDTHAGLPSVHHARYTDAEVDTIVAVHTAIIDAHHGRYTDAEVDAIVAVHTTIIDAHHARYTDAEAISAVSGVTERANAYRCENQSVPSGAWTTVALNMEVYDTCGMFNTTTGEFTIPDTGYYLVVFYVKWGVGSVFPKRFGAGVYRGATPLFDIVGVQTGANGISVGGSNIYVFYSGQVIHLKAYQDSGAAMDIYGGNAASTYMILNRVL